MPRPLATAFAAVALAALVYAGARPLGPVPPLGAFLSPAEGVWALARHAAFPREARAELPGLGGAVDVRYDRRGVPHIFAATEDDAWRALGYVHARDRLFQLELQTRAAAGTLTELAGPAALPLDEEARRIGLAWGAERKFAALDPNSAGVRAMRAYAAGVNAYVDHLAPADLPLEYRLLHRAPLRWEPKHSMYLLERMGYTLAYGDDERVHEQVAARVGEAAARSLMPEDAPIQEPIVPVAGRTAPRYDFRPLAPPAAPGERVSMSAHGLAVAAAAFPRAVERAATGDALGSNNWAVAPGRTAAGRALLAGDPHLELTLPSIWYEAHVVVPGRLDVYGATIPGAPWVVIGFNRDVAWTFTNTGADVSDYYRETVDDAERPTRYQVDGVWRPLVRQLSPYRGPDGRVLATDTLYYTHRGPMRRDAAGRWISMRWTVLEPSDENSALLGAQHARSAVEWLRAAEGFTAPAQNMLVADRAGTIAIRANGRFPRRPAGASGDTVQDGSRSASDWTGWLSVAEAPAAVNPAQRFLASANQEPRDPAAGGPSLGSNWFAPWRAMRINQLLRANAHATPDDMRRYQTDPASPRADAFVPLFLAASRARPANADAAAAAAWLARWDRRYTLDNTGAVLFERAMRRLDDYTWDELGADVDTASRARPERVYHPQDMILLELAQDSASVWWDRRATSAVERRDDVIAAALALAWRDARARFGPPGPAWRWARVNSTDVPHVLRIPALGRLHVPVAGGPSTLSPSNGSGFAASWRMVVEMGPELRAWATYPGGQSANPASALYANRIPQWAAGGLDALYLPRTAAAMDASHTAARLTLAPAER